MIAACLPNPKVFTVVPLSRWVATRNINIQRQMNNIDSDPDVQKLLE